MMVVPTDVRICMEVVGVLQTVNDLLICMATVSSEAWICMEMVGIGDI